MAKVRKISTHSRFEYKRSPYFWHGASEKNCRGLPIIRILNPRELKSPNVEKILENYDIIAMREGEDVELWESMKTLKSLRNSGFGSNITYAAKNNYVCSIFRRN